MNLVAGFVVVCCGIFFIAVTGVAFTRPAIVERFFMAFASSARTHYLEQALRLLVGAALVLLSPAMWQPNVFWILGWAIVVSSAALMCIPWQWHHRVGERVLPMFVRHLKLYAVGMLAFGVFLLYGVFAGGAA